MSKTKTKRARRDAKRESIRKHASHHHRKAQQQSSIPAASTPQQQQRQDAPKSAKHISKKHKSTQSTVNRTALNPQHQQHHSPIPFSLYDTILLLGEGDFSFTRTLAQHHGCANVVGTSYDTEAQVRAKYPTFKNIHTELTQDLTPPVPLHYGVDATKVGSYKVLRRGGGLDLDEVEGEAREDREGAQGSKWQGWDTICFMFPHTGGLSTDVNRQVRANQALIVDFFKSCLDTDNSGSYSSNSKPPLLNPQNGRIILTLFEGEPYTLWNARDLARHAGLRVVQSWRFDWEQYPGYGHVRTLGAVEGKGGHWKGEDREARMFILERVGNAGNCDGTERKREEREGKRKRRGNDGGDSGED